MFAQQFHEGEPFRCAGNDFVMLLPRDITQSCEAVLEMLRPGASTPPNSHKAFVQIYLIWSGKAEIHVGSETKQLTAPAVAFVPRNTEHWAVNLSSDQELHYLYISVWPKGIPENEIQGGWKKVYADIVETYVSRGYPVEAGK
jgi:quercetin dioxygenase-like cupin family protein